MATFDAVTDGGDNGSVGATHTFAHTVGAGSDRVLFVAVIGSEEIGATHAVTGVTYGGVAMTLIDNMGGDMSTGNRDMTLWRLANPSTGSNNVVITSNATDRLSGVAISYHGAGAVNVATVGGNFVGSATSLTTSLTTTVDNCWLLVFENVYTLNNPPGAGAGTTVRAVASDADNFYRWGLFDSNGPKTPAGLHGLTTTRTENRRIQHLMVAIEPAAVVPNDPPIVDAGPDVTAPFTGSGTLAGSVSDDGLPNPPGALTVGWTVVFGTGTLTVTDPTDPESGYTVDLPGTYILELTADDGESEESDQVTLVFTEPEIDDDSCEAASPGPAICGNENVLTWIEQTQRKTDATTETRVTSDAALNDPSTYYSGKKEPRILQLPEITRQLSSVRGQWQGSTMRWREAETDLVVRKRFESTLRYPVVNATDVCRMIRESDYAARNDARLMFIGHRLRSEPAEDLSIEHESGDQLARDLAVAGQEVHCPRRLFSASITQGIPAALVKQPEPIIYGKYSDELSAETPPDMTFTAPFGGYADGGGGPVFGWAPTGGPAAPTAVSCTEVGGGSIDTGDHTSDRFFALVWHVDGSGVEGDPDTYDQRTPGGMAEVTLTGSGKSIQVDWTKTGTPAQTRVALGHLSSGIVRYSQVATVNGAVETFTFDNVPDALEIAAEDYTQLATGATRIIYGNFAYYRIAAQMPDGQWTVLSSAAAFTFASGFAETGPYRRPARLEFENVPATATTIGIWKYAAGAELPLGYFSIPYTGTETWIDDDWLGTTLLDGSPPQEIGKHDLVPWYGGTELSTADGRYYHRWFVASHACARVVPYVDGVRIPDADSPIAWLWPGSTGYTDRFGAAYRDIGGRRYAVVYGWIDHPDPDAVFNGTKTLRANVWGVTENANGTGAVLTDIHDQFLHWFKNFGPLGDYQTGDYLDAPTWSPVAAHCKINAESWRTVRDAASAAFGSSLVGGGAIAELRSQRDWLASWLVSIGARVGQNAAGQWTLVRHDPAAAPSATYTEIRHVQAGSVSFDPLHDEHWTFIPFRFGFDPVTGTWQEGKATSAAEETAYSEPRPGPTFEMHFVQSPTLAQWVMDLTLDRHKTLPWRVRFETIDLCGTNSDNGDVIGLTGSWGLGVDGWQAFPIFLETHTTLTNEQRARLTGRTNVAPHEA